MRRINEKEATVKQKPKTTDEMIRPHNLFPKEEKQWWKVSIRSRLRSLMRRREIQKLGAAERLLPVVIEVFAGFSKVDGKIVEADIDSSLGFLRYDYPKASYSELRRLYTKALHQPQDLNEIAGELAGQLSEEEKITLGMQLYVLISGSDLHKEQLISFYLFMTNLGIGSQAIDIVYQLNTPEEQASAADDAEEIEQWMETLQIADKKPADVVFRSHSQAFNLIAFRYQNQILLKNVGKAAVLVRGRALKPTEFCRFYEGQRIVLGEFVVDYQDLVFYFNTKKDVSSTQLFLNFETGGAPYLEKSRSKHSFLEIKFGLGVIVHALRTTKATVNGIKLREGTTLEVSLQDKILFRDRTEVTFGELRRRARELGGRFELLPSRTEYLVSNNPNLLRPGDILLSPGSSGELLLRIRRDYGLKTGELEILTADRPILIQGTPVKERAELSDNDTITIGEGQFLRCHFSDRIIEEERNIISELEVREISHSYANAPKETALDGVSFVAKRGELICVMGPSGCGKSTMLRCLAGLLKPKSGEVRANGYSIYNERYSRALRPYISYIPQDESFDALLTVQENISYAAAIRAPHFTALERQRRVDGKLVELGLNQQRHQVVGELSEKVLSGGERKRLNVGMDMIGNADIYLIDEPTSGLSSKDSEHVLEIVRGLSHNKVVIVSIHQPSSRLFQIFDKAILLDHGGKLAFYGRPQEMLEYFREALDDEPVKVAHQNEYPINPKNLQPDFIFDVLESPLRDLGGEVMYDEDDRGHLTPLRRFPPNYWRDRFQAHRTMQEITEANLDSKSKPSVGGKALLPQPPSRRFKDEWLQFVTLFKRSFLSKFRNKSNLITTLLEAPALALLVGFVLRYSEEGTYTFAAAFHIPTYLFLTLVIGMFLGLTNSANEIIRDRPLLIRERNLRVRLGHYVLSKAITLGIFAVLQSVVYLLMGNLILEIRGMFWTYLLWMSLTAITGSMIGLVISSLVSNVKTALNLIPMVLIPQIILGGALIRYEEMNANLDLLYTFERLLKKDSTTAQLSPPSRLKVPLICEFMPLRWSYEAIIISQAKHNPITKTKENLKARIQSVTAHETLTEKQEDELNQCKDALAMVSWLEARNPAALDRSLRKLQKTIRNGTFNIDDYDSPKEESVTAEQLYINQKVADLVNKAEIERNDYRTENAPNVFFGREKTFGDQEFATVTLNFGVLIIFTFLGLGVLHFGLYRQMSKV